MNLKTIAQKAGVSTATVSNVINGNHHKVSKETLLKVQKIIEENDYKPNATARSLASKESKIIGVVIPNIDIEENFAINPNDAYTLALLENYIRKQGYYLMVRCVRQCKEIVPLFSSWNVDGMIFFGTFKDEVEDIQKSLDIPIVYLDTYAEGLQITNVGIDDYKGGYLAARYILGKGHRKIAFVCPNVNSPGVIQQRFQGFRAACAEKGVELTSECIFETNTFYDNGVVVGQKIAISPEKFTAVFATADIVALGIVEGVRLTGMHVPNDISVMGFDNLKLSTVAYSGLTTISQNVEKKVDLAGEYLFKMIREKERIIVNEKIDVEIIERLSVKDINPRME